MRCVWITLALLLLPVALRAETYVVHPDGSGDYPTIQAAIDAAVDGDIIELTDGIFRGDGNRDIAYLRKEITIRSASGDPYGCVVDCEGGFSDPHFGFRFDAVGPDALLQGVMICNGYSEGWGGAIQLFGASPLIRDCVFRGNRAGSGGAINCDMEAEPRLVRCTFWENYSRYGGGAICI